MTNKKLSNIEIIWAKSNNLQNIDISIPKNKIITITGVSGSWKSTLAFDTIYKEWQFRYIESLSSYLRQFFNLGERPDIDYCEWFSPSIAIEQNKKVGNSRSSVGTLTEVDDYLRLLFAKIGDIYCHSCGRQIKAESIESIVSNIHETYENQKVYLIQQVWHFETKNDFFRFLRKNRKRVDAGKGYVRYLVTFQNDYIEYFYMEEPNLDELEFPIEVFWVFDRVRIEENKTTRLKEDIIKLLGETKKFGIIPFHWEKPRPKRYTDKNFCPDCDITYPEFTPQYFSPNRQEWACPTCQWIWETLQVDFEKIIDHESPYMEAILPWRDSNLGQGILDKLADKYWINKALKWKDIPNRYKEIVINWDKKLLRIQLGWKYVSMYYNWIEEVLTDQYHKWVLTVDFQAMINLNTCPTCNGAKLRKESLNVFINIPYNKKNYYYNIFDLQQMPISELDKLIQKYQKSNNKPRDLVLRITNPLIDRVSTISWLGLTHITSSRQIYTLSWWEIQRLRLAKQLGNKLTWIIYVLDEPTIGLDEQEIKRTIKAIKTLKEMWNSIIVVEHNEDFIKNSDWIIEIGPGAGDFGWEVIFNWPYKDFIKKWTFTGKYITQENKVNVNFEHKPSKDEIKIKKANKNNLKNIDINFTLWSFTIVTWPSGAGKTTVMYDIFYKFLNEKQKFIQSYIRLHLLKKWYSWSDIISWPALHPNEYKELESYANEEFFKEIWVESIRWTENINNVIYVDQTSIWKTPRSCPATFIWVFDDIRKLFAWTSDAKMLSFDSGHFSFNSKKGACPECDGYWHKKIELQFLPDTYVPCELCNWKRYKQEILAIKWNWKTISEVLDMYTKDALEFFQDIGFIKDKLQLMVDIGLGYLKLGQPAHTLSWWESQRLKLVKHLLKSYKGHTVYFLDEPTVGLHPSDIEKLLNVLKRFLDNQDSIFMIEHDQNLLKFADKVIRLENWEIVKNN